MPALLAVPNVSEGSDPGRLAELERAFSRGATLLDRHTDSDHDRTVFSLAGPTGGLVGALTEAGVSKEDAPLYAEGHGSSGQEPQRVCRLPTTPIGNP